MHFVTLGCPKNRVDSELMLGHLQDAEMTFTETPDDADVIVVNTCGFIEDAKRESIDVILEMARHKAEGNAKRLIVTGCLVQRYSKELAAEIPEIDALLGTGEYTSVVDVARQATRTIGADGSSPSKRLTERVIKVEDPTFIHAATTPRLNTFMPHSAYIKVSEGCDQKCTFCIIPALRGLQRSRPIDDVVREAQFFAERGVVEANLVAQDLTGYGTDLEPKRSLADLVRAIAKVDLPWIRLHYAYPRPFSKALLAAIAEEPRILPYIDMPLQHISDPVLKRMARGRPRRFIEKLLADIRAAVPHVTLRTSFIVGFPGETEAQFEELLDYVKHEDFAHVGVFKFSREEGTPSYDLDGQVPQEVIDERHHRLMALLKKKSKQRLKKLVGKRLEVLVDGPHEETELLLKGRHKGQAPEIDGNVLINDGDAVAGDLVEVEISETFEYDLVGGITRVIRPAPRRPTHARLEASAPVAAPMTAGRRSLRVVS
ncbi:30S ribosomal protein S12 methylthiotransferase RimO [Myxococcota bacterium]|nr:30S ribosomal protein S12 methylthiotransferase RimO [Myxococcota bacterium]